jgi:hypothetical protein
MLSNSDQSGSTDNSADGTADLKNYTDRGDSPARGDGRAIAQGQRRRGRGHTKNGLKTRRARVRAPQASGTMSLEILAKEYIWLWDVRHGISTNEIAVREGVTARRVQYGLLRARSLEKSSPDDSAIDPPRLIPLFPIGSYTPHSTCAHNKAIEAGSLFCCMVCHCSGIDDHPGLVRTALTDPAPEPKAAPVPKKTNKETRKQQRQRRFGIQPLMANA